MSYFLTIAYYLSVLTFYLGVLIYALPIPVTGLKRWGPRLIIDSFFILGLALTIDTITAFADHIRTILGGSWDAYEHFIKSTILEHAITITILAEIQMLLSKLLIGFAKILSILVSKLTLALYALIAMYMLSELIRYSYWILATLGIALMAIPFRIARGAGAFLLAFSLVFYVAIPLFPHFVFLLLTPADIGTSFPLIYGNIVNEYNSTLYHGYLLIENSDGNRYGPIPIFGGRYAIISFTRELELNDTITIYYDVVGHLFYTNVTNLTIAEICKNKSLIPIATCKLDILVYGVVLYDNGRAIHVFPKVNNVNVFQVSPELINISINTPSDTSVYISLTNAYSLYKVCIDSSCIEDASSFLDYCWTWYGAYGCTYRFSIPAGKHNIAFYTKLNLNTVVQPFEGISTYAMMYIPSSATMGFLEYLARFLYVEIVAAILYLTILISITLGLARLLGGVTRLRVII